MFSSQCEIINPNTYITQQAHYGLILPTRYKEQTNSIILYCYTLNESTRTATLHTESGGTSIKFILLSLFLFKTVKEQADMH